ncbi:hypothetical protein BY458DRAFT_507217 [Sporodiniella umbellata]|nr:hypothetical protein BY458DRAFT_507217 [Sporodiniella umbellata]
MLSASPMSSNAFSSPSMSTPTSPHSENVKNPSTLYELIESERTYLKTLNTIDSQVTSTWMKQTTTIAPDFSELLESVNEISKVNQRFYTELQKLSQNSSTDQGLPKLLLSWVDDLKESYTGYCRSYIPNLDQRTAILSNPFISSLLQELSDEAYETTLGSLLDAPLERLKYYKNLYSRFLEKAGVNATERRPWMKANVKINGILCLAEKHQPASERVQIQTGFESELKRFESQVDCSRTMDFNGGTCIDYQAFRIATPGSELVLRDSFGLVANQQNGSTVRVHLVLTTQVLVICRELKPESYSLMFPPIPIGDIVVRAESLERGLLGDYLIRCSILNRTHLVFRADSKETRNTWVGADHTSSTQALQHPQSMSKVAEKRMLGTSLRLNPVRNTDIFTYYSESGGVSPLDSSDEDSLRGSTDGGKRCDPKTMKALPSVPQGEPPGQVQMVSIEPPTAQMETMTVTPKEMALKPNEMSDKPSSPRAVAVQRAMVPQTMQAVTQKTEDYLESTLKLQPRPVMPRSTSIASLHHKPLPYHANRPPPTAAAANRPPFMPRPPMPMRPPFQGQGYRPQYAGRPMPAPPGRGYAMPPQAPYQAPLGLAPGPGLSHVPSNGSLSEGWHSPPESPSAGQNGIKQVLYSHDGCVVFHWANETWYAAEGRCVLQVRLTHQQRTCMSVELQDSGELYLNAWILPTTVIRQPSATDVSLSVFMGQRKENYLVHFPHPEEARTLVRLLTEAHREASPPPLQQPIEPEEEEPVDHVQCPQTLKPAMQCKAKLYLQTETSKWSTFGTVLVRISQQIPSMRMMIQIENEKNKLVSAVVRSGNVEKISAKRISFLLSDEVQKTSIVYMIQLREDHTGDKVYEYLRVKNAEHGW